MFTPDTRHGKDGKEVPFITRWTILVSSLIIEPSVKLVAHAAGSHRVQDGAGVFASQERIARQTSYDARTVRNAWAVLRSMGMAERVLPSYYDGRKRTSDEYDLVIPDHWRSFPIYGPGMKRFHCQHCGKAFNPVPGTEVRTNGHAGWYLAKMVFCPPPGRPKRTQAEINRRAKPKAPPPSCFDEWGGTGRWRPLKEEAWEMFNKARDDDWPTLAEVKQADQWWDS